MVHVRECMKWAALPDSAVQLEKLERNLLARDEGQQWCAFSELDDKDKDSIPSWSWMRWSLCDTLPAKRRILVGKPLRYVVLILLVHPSSIVCAACICERKRCTILVTLFAICVRVASTFVSILA